MSDYKKVGIDRLGDTLSKELSTYSADVQMGVRLLVDEKSEELKNEIKKNAPVGRRKKYRKSFKVKITNETFRFMPLSLSTGLHTSSKKLVEKEAKKAERYNQRCILPRQQRKFTANLKPELKSSLNHRKLWAAVI